MEIQAPMVEYRALMAHRGGAFRNSEELHLLPIVTLVLWLVCLAVGGMGLSLRYPRPHPPAKEPEPVQAEIVNVELTSAQPPPDAAPPPLDLTQPPPPPDAVVTPQSPPLVAVSAPNPEIAFALPVEGPARQVPAKQASHARPVQTTTAQPAVQQLTFGKGEGNQPAPAYPRESIDARQEGSVLIRFSVGGDGRVVAAEVITPCPWPLLNQSALHAVRDSWSFAPGPLRLYQVTVRFQLGK